MGNLFGTLLYRVGVNVLMAIVWGILISWPLSWLWNDCLVPAVSGLHEVSVLQMWGIAVLIGALFGSNK